MDNPTKQQLAKFDKHHIHEEPIKEQKWLFNGMSKDELRNGYEEVQRELKECENVKD